MASEGAAAQAQAAGTLINGRFRPTKRLGSGSFGEIYMGIGAGGERVAIKFEKAGLRCPQLRHEYKVYRELSGSTGIGKVHHYGTYGSSNVMVMDLLGASLEDLFTRCGRRFSLKTTLKLADQLLERVDAIHARHLIHRDIKPANFVMGSDTSELCYCIDFGLSKRYRNPHTLAHIPHRVGKSLTGTPRYASINNHLGIEQARRDDLEAIGYVLVYFLKGRLPWQGLKARNASRKYKMIMEKKQSTSINTLCAGCPKEFAEYLSYCRSLKFEASPNIKYLRQLFRDLYQQQGYALSTYGDADWDWNRLEQPKAGLDSGDNTQTDTNGKPLNSRAMNSKPYGMYSNAADSTGGSRPNSASAQRPTTAATAAARGGSIGGGDTRPESAVGDRSAAIGNSGVSGAAGSEGTGGGDGGHKLNLPAGGLPRSIGDANSSSRPKISSRSRPESSSGAAGIAGGGGGSTGGRASSAGGNRAWSDSIRSGSGGAVVRRPQSAHGARSSPKTAAAAVRQNSYSGVQGSGNDAYVVAGAKSMMTYRRSRGSNYPADNMRTTSSGQRISDDGNPAWGRPKPSGRPKSAGLIGSRMTGNSGSSQGNASGGGGRSSGAGRSGSNGRAPYYMTQARYRGIG